MTKQRVALGNFENTPKKKEHVDVQELIMFCWSWAVKHFHSNPKILRTLLTQVIEVDMSSVADILNENARLHVNSTLFRVLL